MSLQLGHSPQKSSLSVEQLRDLARERAVRRLPHPSGPTNKNACATLSLDSAFLRMAISLSWPKISLKDILRVSKLYLHKSKTSHAVIPAIFKLVLECFYR